MNLVRLLPRALTAMVAALLCVFGVAAPALLRGQPAGAAPPTSPTDESKVPHYYGPYSNWANSPQVMANAVITLTGGGGVGATATANVNSKDGSITSIDVTAPGGGYTAPPDVLIDSPGVTPTALASATATIGQGVVTSVTVGEPGFGFQAPTVGFSGGGTPTTAAAATASGGVDNLTLVDGGSGYTTGQPAVFISAPDVAGRQATASATADASGIITSVDIVDPGAGYTKAPTITVFDGQVGNAVANPAKVESSVNVTRIDITDGGLGYDSAPDVTILDADGTDRGASATAKIASKGAVTGVTVTAPGVGYLTPGIKKFVDTLPGLGAGAANDLGEYIPVAQADTTTYTGADYYEIAVVQYRHRFHKDLPPTLLRGYVQLSTPVVPGKHIPLVNEMPDGTSVPVVDANGKQYEAVDNPSYLGPTIVAQKDRPTRILFRNLLPTGVAGDLFLPVDTTAMGSGPGPDMMKLDANGVPMDMAADQGSVLDGVRNPMCGDTPKDRTCYSENRATLHLHGGITPWISDGTPHQWTTPAGEDTAYPKGVSVSNVPDMPDPGPGAETFFYTNQQSARLMFYHDHAWGITRLNVYAGEAAGYLLTDAMEQKLIGAGGALEGLGYGTPLVIQDKTFVPSDVHATDPTWDTAKWGGEGSLWTPHVYMPAQNPDDPSGVSPFGRWMYGPYFWPPATPKHGAIPNPYYNKDPKTHFTTDLATPCNLDDSATWQYQDYPYCEPKTIPGTPNQSVGMEAFQDTPVVNGVAYPTTTVDPKAYRFRILNAANDRFWNLQWYVADPTTGTLSEVALKQSELDAAQTDPNVFPTPDTTKSPVGPSWIQIGTEGGFLPTPAVVPNQPITWITDPTRFDFGNVDKHSLLLAPAERADTIVDFSQYRGKTLILYNDAPAAFPARQANQDYYTGDPDMRPAGAPSTLPGYGPNTRTIMQIKVSSKTPDIAFDRTGTTADRMGALIAAFAHHSDGSGVFESASDPIVVGQNAYNTAYGTSFAASGYCGGSTPSPRCDGYARIQQQGGDKFTFDTLSGQQLSIPIQPKAIHDEMNSANFDEYGRMTANLGLEGPGASPTNQNIVLYPYVNPPTENLDADGLPSSLHVTPISSSSDGTQIWKITHNGVDTHPIHFHLFDVQVLDRVTWDNIIMPPDPNELGWKDTVRVSPLEDTIVAVRPIVPTLPFGVPDSKRPLNPMMPIGARGSATGQNGLEAGFNSTDANGNPTATPIVNDVYDFGWEYVYHCHILSHEEMDMMRPVSVRVSSAVPDAPVLSFTRGSVDLSWTDGTPVNYADLSTWGSKQNEVGFRVERAEVTNGVAGAWVKIADVPANRTTYTDNPADPTITYDYRVTAWNQAGAAESNVQRVIGLPKAPVNLQAQLVGDASMPAGNHVDVTWSSGGGSLTGYVLERSVGNGAFSQLAAPAATDTSFSDLTVVPGTYSYRLKAVNDTLSSAWAGPVTVTVPQAASTTSLVAAPDPSVTHQAVTFTATVAPVAANAVPSGTVTFTVDGTDVVTQPLDASSAASWTTSTLPAGQHLVTATYNGDANLLPSTSGVSNQTVDKQATAVTLTSSKNPSVLGDPIVFTATVAPPDATGTIDFLVDAGVISVPIVNGSASYPTSALALGGHTITARYNGDASYLGAVSTTITQTVGTGLRATTTTVTSSLNPSAYGRTVTFTATVARVSGTGTPTGLVQFVIDGVNAGAPVALNTGRARYSTAALAAGAHTVVAVYTGSSVFAGSSSQPLVESVLTATSTTTLTASRTSASLGRAITFTARVTPVAATGTVQFYVDGSAYGGPAALDATGRATLSLTTLAVGAHTVQVLYLGNANYGPSQSATVTVTVTKGSSRTTLATSGSPATRGTAVVFTATVAPVAPAFGTPTGTVQFRIDGVDAGTPVPLNAAGQAAMATTTLTVGFHSVTAVYSGDGQFTGSTSGTLTQRIR